MDIAKVDPGLRTATEKSPKINIENSFMRMFAASASSLIPGKRVDGVERRLVRHGGVKLRVYVPARPIGSRAALGPRRRAGAGRRGHG